LFGLEEGSFWELVVSSQEYERLTPCSADEIQEMLDEPDSQSPDIGPPPVARFDNEGPITFNPEQANEEQNDDGNQDGEPALSANLETRKKRRESGPKLNIRRVSMFESPPENVEEEPQKVTKTGSKRKFSVQEDEDKIQSNSEPFRFSRRNAPGSETEASNDTSRPSSPERPILASSKFNSNHDLVL
jgi:hypothetical protein